MKELQDECYQRLRETQKLSRSKANDYYDNRRFSQKVCSSPGTCPPLACSCCTQARGLPGAMLMSDTHPGSCPSCMDAVGESWLY